MPILELRLGVEPEHVDTASLAKALTLLTVTHLKKKPELVAVAIQFIRRGLWQVAGTTLEDARKNSYFLDIRVTDETNTKEEKAAFVSAAHLALSELIGDVHEISYIHVHDVRASAYGFGGKTQEWRFQRPPASQPA